ncbi:MAG TPA: class I SAM-dependent methyltransferase [Planctomycetaceae bacterium]|jgi:SAM-dependent methyltransferase|nr:class I SAM-dependent methyltransferase [Planctomycetaceae bacterium]
MALYDKIGRNYADLRRPDRRIAAVIDVALGDAASVVNVGAGAGSYEPAGRTVLAVEPSAVMIRQRPAGAAACLCGSAESLPVETACVDAAMAVLTLHHWTDAARGLAEMVRVARKRVVLLTWVPDAEPYWLTQDYFPEIAETDRRLFPTTPGLKAMLERLIGPVEVQPVPVPHDCTDGFLCAYWRRPESYLNAEVRSAISSFAKLDAEPGVAKLRRDLESGHWAERNRRLLQLDTLDVGYRIVRCEIRDTNKVRRGELGVR